MTGKWYATLECTNTVHDPLVLTDADLKGTEEWGLVTGQPAEHWDEATWFRPAEPENDGDPDDVLQNHMVRLQIYSARLRKALEQAGITGIQYLPARVSHFDGSPISGFAIANIVDVVAALDLERSDYSRFGPERPDRMGEIVGLRMPVLRGAALEGHDVIRLKEYPLYVCVSQRFKDAFEAGGFTGYSFRPLELT
jgi:hypothetical protein